MSLDATAIVVAGIFSAPAYAAAFTALYKARKAKDQADRQSMDPREEPSVYQLIGRLRRETAEAMLRTGVLMERLDRIEAQHGQYNGDNG